MRARRAPEPKRTVPLWAVVAALVVIVGVVVAFGVRSFMGGRATAPDREVRPGMIDFQEELRRGNVGGGTP